MLSYTNTLFFTIFLPLWVPNLWGYYLLLRKNDSTPFLKKMSYDVFLIGEFNLNILVKTAWRYSNSKYFFSNFDVTLVAYFSSLSLLTKMKKNAEMLEMSLKSYQSFKIPVNFSFWRILMKLLHNVVLYKHFLKNIFW